MNFKLDDLLSFNLNDFVSEESLKLGKELQDRVTTAIYEGADKVALRAMTTEQLQLLKKNIDEEIQRREEL